MSLFNKICLILLFGICCEAKLKKEAYMTIPSIIRAAGYPVETHRVTTPDGYVLQMYRIPAGRRSTRSTGDLNAKGKKAILFQHGWFGGSENFVIMGPERSLAYLLADAGYDVWLGNLRGTVYSSHTNLTKDDPKFWDFSLHEFGEYDIPAMIDGVLNVTGLEKIIVLGHSLGGTTYFIMMSVRPEYNDKVMFFLALGPAMFADNFKELANFALNTLNVTNILRQFGIVSIQPEIIRSLVASYCNWKKPITDPCTNLIFFLGGEDYEQADFERLPIILHKIEPISTRAMEHYGKIAITGEFTTFEGGLSGPVVPYNVSNIKAPVSLIYAENDHLTEKSQIMRIAKILKSIGSLEEVRPATSWHKFNHFDFVFAKDVGTLLNKPLVKYIDQLYDKYKGK